MTEPVRWGVLGCARVFERRMVPGFALATNATLWAIASRSEEKAPQVAARHGIPHYYGGNGAYERLLADPQIEAVYIPLPNDQHADWTRRALEAGKHVLCDKPMTLSAADAKANASLAQYCGLRLMEGFMWRHHPQHARIKEIVESGMIGDIRQFRGVFSYKAVADPNNIRWQPAQGGGALLDVGVYPVNAARYHFDDEPVRVYATASRDTASGVDVSTTALLEWEDGRTAFIVGAFDQAFTSRYEIIGTEGSVSAERAFQVGEKGVMLTVRVGDDVTTETLPHVDQYGLEIEHFSACVRDTTLPLAPGEDGVMQARIVDALRQSLETGTAVRL